MHSLLGHIALAIFLSLLFLILSILKSSINSLSKIAIRQVAESRGDRYIFYSEKLYSNPSEMRIAIQLSRQIAFVGAIFALLSAFMSMGLKFPSVLAFLFSIFLLIILMEQLLARLFVAIHPKKAYFLTLPLLPLLYFIFIPLMVPIYRILGFAKKTFGEPSNSEDSEAAKENINAFIDAGEKEGIFEEEEGEMVKSIVSFGDTMAREVMTPRTDMITMEVHGNVKELITLIRKEKHTRIPIFKETIDNIIGIVYVRDLLEVLEGEGNSKILSELMRPAYFVPETKKVSEILKEMQKLKIQMAIVVDEYGGTAGLVTIEDLLEEIVGDIHDVHELEEEDIIQEGGHSYIVKGSCHVEKLEAIFEQSLKEEDFDTVGGLVFAKLGKIPSEGESLEWKGITFTILSANKRRIRKVRVKALQDISHEGR